MSDDLEAATLYVRGMNMPEDDVEDVWDDTVLNNAYDRALKIANDEVAKRIAMETNTKSKDDSDMDDGQEKKSKPKKQKAKAGKWKAGMPCRALYDDDGMEYEAFLVKTINEDEGVVKFLGYDNVQRVSISTLKPSLGNKERMRQVETALSEKPDDGFESQPSEHSQTTVSPVERSTNRKKRSQKNKKKNNTNVVSDTSDLPHIPMPNLDMFRNMSTSMTMPMPPPPPLSQLNTLCRTDGEEQAISDMLLSWYMTGYYTGLYQGMKRQNQNGKSN